MKNKTMIYLCFIFFALFILFNYKPVFCGEVRCRAKGCVDIVYKNDVRNVKRIVTTRLLKLGPGSERTNVTVYVYCDEEWQAKYGFDKANSIVSKACSYLKDNLNINCQIKGSQSWKSNDSYKGCSMCTYDDLEENVCDKHKGNITIGFSAQEQELPTKAYYGIASFDKGCSIIFDEPTYGLIQNTAVVIHELGHNYGLVLKGSIQAEKNDPDHCSNKTCAMHVSEWYEDFKLCDYCKSDWSENRKRYK